MCASFLAQPDRLGAFGAHFGAQKMIFSRFGIKKAARVDRSDASAGLTFSKNGAKETRTPDPLHAMQVLFGSSTLLQLAQVKNINNLEQNLEHTCCDFSPYPDAWHQCRP